jgi:DNA-directed RNA polymerase specialized sigma24 family protein
LDDPYDSRYSQSVTRLDLHRYRAERLLRRDFHTLRSKVLAVVRTQLRAKGLTLDPAELEACYAQAWHGLYATVLEGEAVENPSAWLVLVTFRRAIDESRSAGRRQRGEESSAFAGEIPGGWSPASSTLDLAADLDRRARLREVFEGFRTRLSERECEAASLCYLQGLSRADAAERMGISEARMRKLMEGAGAGRPGVAGKVGELLDTIKTGGWCEQQSSLMRAYAFGVLDPDGERHALAAAHCRECPACRAHVASLRGLASVLPLPLLPRLALAGGTGTVAGAGMRTAPGGGGGGGFAGSLTVKLAVAGVALLGSGYAVLGTRAHGSPPVHRLAVPTRTEGEGLSQIPSSGGSKKVRGRPSSGSSARLAHKSPHPQNHRVAPEFGPERVQGEGARPQTSYPGSAHEFGFE